MLSCVEHGRSFITSGPGLQMRVRKLNFFYFSTKTYVVGFEHPKSMILIHHVISLQEANACDKYVVLERSDLG